MPTVRLALIPTGATEQHGPNLALSTDYMAGHRLAQRLAQRLHPSAVVVPAIPFGLSYHHTGFAGTVTLSAESFIAVCVDVAKSMQRNGIQHILFVNGHAGNTAILNVITQKLHYELGLSAATMFYFAQAADKLKEHAQSPRFGHACEIETSVLMELAPELVRKEALQPGDMIESELKLAFNNEPFALQIPVPFHEQTRNGVFGDARLADPAIGKDIVETALDRAMEFVDSFLSYKGTGGNMDTPLQ